MLCGPEDSLMDCQPTLLQLFIIFHVHFGIVELMFCLGSHENIIMMITVVNYDSAFIVDSRFGFNILQSS